MKRRTKDQTVADIALIVVCALVVLVAMSIYGCATSDSRHKPDVVTYNDTTPAIASGLTTQKAATEAVRAGEETAAGHVTAAQGDVRAVNAQTPDPRLTTADHHLTAANQALDANAGKLANLIASEVQLIGMSIDQATKNAALKKSFDAEALAKAKAEDRADKAEAFIKAHENDFLGAKVHRFFRGVSIALLITLGIVLIGVGIIGAIYGLPKITAPAATIAGGVINAVRVGLYHAATFVWSLLPAIGHYIDEHLNTAGKNARIVAETKGAA